MKTFKNIYRSAALMLCGGALAFTACTDGNDWSADGSHARLFAIGSSSLKVSDVGNDSAVVSFDTQQGVKVYVLELSTDTLTEDNPNINPDSRVVELTGSPDTIRGLNGETKYYLRVKGKSNGISDSKWIYYEASNGKRFFTTKAQQLFLEKVAETDKLENQITIRWKKPKGTEKVTNLKVLYKGEEIQNIALTGSEPIDENGNYYYAVTGLKSGTSYTFELYDGDIRRGKLSVKTAAAPETDSYVYTVPAGTSVSNSLVKTKAQEAFDAGKNNLTIVLKAGENYKFGYNDDDATSGSVLAPTANTVIDGEPVEVGMSVTFLGEGGDRATLTFKKNFDSKGDHTNIVFRHLNLVDDGANYFFNQSDATNVENMTVEDCELKDFKNAFFRMQGGTEKVISNLNLVNCIFHDMCSGYSFVHVDAGSGKGVLKNLYISNCTLYNIAEGGKMFIYSNETNMESIKIENLTMNNSIGNNNFLIDFGKTTTCGVEGEFTITNSIFGASAKGANKEKNIRGTKQPVVSNTIHTQDCVWEVGDLYSGKAEDLFKDPDNGDFTIQDAGVTNMGDSRWQQ